MSKYSIKGADSFYAKVKKRADWSFDDIPRKATTEMSHGYHGYPAKFIPQLAHALLEEYTEAGDAVWDSFCGSGTLNLEAFRMGRTSVGSDINPTATLIARVKTRPLNPALTFETLGRLRRRLQLSPPKAKEFYLANGVLNGNLPLLKDWFPQRNLLELSHILHSIKTTSQPRDFMEFELCAFSAILKRSSFWLASSVKSQKDPDKTPGSPLNYFNQQLDLMEVSNQDLFYENAYNRTPVRVLKQDARTIKNGVVGPVDAIITSPPYVVSYDYSDIFRLSTHFLFYTHDLLRFRKRFVGTPLAKAEFCIEDAIETAITNPIKDRRVRHGLNRYFHDMRRFLEVARHAVSSKGKLILVVGDTQLRGVAIPNTFLLLSLAKDAGWQFVECFERDIPNKNLPSLRNKKSGKFMSNGIGKPNQRYKSEFILVLEKSE